MSHQLEQAILEYQKVQRAERAFAKANHDLNRSLIHLPNTEMAEYYKRTEGLRGYEEQTHTRYP